MTTSITVCLCTYRRPHLAETLNSLQQQQLPDDVHLSISIADNDLLESGRALVEAFQQHSDLQVSYAVQPQKNISMARNTSVANARGQWLAFIDDDEKASPTWLATLLACARQFDADAVMGQVDTRYPEQTPEWISAGNYFSKSLPPTGTHMDVGSTCNALVKRSVLPHPSAPFDVSRGTLGGEDTTLFHDIHARGGVIVSCREAVVSELVEPQRLNRHYLLQKATRIGETYAAIFFTPLSPAGKTVQFLKAFAQTVIAAFGAVLLRPIGKKHSFRYVMRMMSNWGKVRYFFNTPPVELYK
ncbi:glycosyltransferase family 2 protein [Ferrimonas sp. SCSIO 43195]|uniref:glycosyltransferase family 2 protein n=1 Tax=Ferrimonas sp. SCSIO 43195 TaxID=2822844 RepID=UPI002074E454|nr:glycosyltransferase family 2 protein [Ferrimonas sp. SCSIO 43195]USD36067.1 glycosyltransferase family 2 protein [Ferrimonas sp. SCSIO 43195]